MCETGFRPISLIIAECDELLLTCIKSAQKFACIESNFDRMSYVTPTIWIPYSVDSRAVACHNAMPTWIGSKLSLATLRMEPEKLFNLETIVFLWKAKIWAAFIPIPIVTPSYLYLSWTSNFA